uniref:GDNF family receptor alpha-2 n=1 Tax=Zonotrichia albicollis TaxID=44394 RepID=A0A8D2MRD4_ZONAL
MKKSLKSGIFKGIQGSTSLGSAWIWESRLADFHTNCQATFQSMTNCPGDNFQACLGSYAGLIGFDITPNYVDASTTSITISPWCSCKGSGNMEEECEKFLRDFTENPCLRNAIQAFGNGTDVNLAPKIPNPAVTEKVEKSPVLPDDVNDSNTAYDTSVISTCTSLQVGPSPCRKLGALVGVWDTGCILWDWGNVLLGLIQGLEGSGHCLGREKGFSARLTPHLPSEPDFSSFGSWNSNFFLGNLEIADFFWEIWKIRVVLPSAGLGRPCFVPWVEKE